MVAGFDGIIHFGTVRLDVRAYKYVVNTEIHATIVVADARTVAAACIGVIQFARQAMMDV